MSEHTCLKEKEWGEITTTLNYIKDKLCNHVTEGEKEGGHRDQLRDNIKDTVYLKKQISEIKKSQWKVGIISGLIVGVVIKSPEIGHLVLMIITKLAFACQ